MSVLDLPARIAELERRLAAHEQKRPLPAPDQLTPNVFTINPDGTISETLTGKLTAEGVDFEEAQSLKPAALNMIRWLREGKAAEQIYGARAGGESELVLRTLDPGENAVAALQIIEERITAAVAPHAVTLLNAAGASSFLQLGAGVANAQLIYGISKVKWAVKGFESEGKVIATPFATSAAWVAFPIIGSAAAKMGSGGAEANQLTFVMRSDTELAAGSEAFFSYFIVGH